MRKEYKRNTYSVIEEQDLLNKSLEESKITIYDLRIHLEEAKRIYEVTKSDLGKTDKECQKLEEDLVNLRKEYEENKDELNMMIKYDGNTEALDKLLSKKKYNKDINGAGFEKGQCSNNKDSSRKEINFTSSSESEVKQTFIVNKPNEKKKYVVATKNQSMNQHANPIRKSNVDDGGFTKVNDTRTSSRRLNYIAPRRPIRDNFNNDWYVPQFHGYYYKCNTYGHRIVDCKLMRRSPPSFESRIQFASCKEVK